MTIKPAPGVSPAISGSSATALIVLNGIDYVTIDGSNSGGSSRDMTISNTNAGTSSADIWGQTVTTADPTTNNTVKNLNLSGNASTTTFAGVGFGSTTIGTSTLGTRNDNNRVQNDSITQVQFGVVSVGSASAAKNFGTVVTGNTLGGAGLAALGRAGVWVAFDDGAQVTNNTVVNATSNASSDVFGIALGTNAIAGTGITTQDVANVTVTGNSIGTVLETNTFSAAGIALGTPNYGTSRIANNSIYGVNANSTPSDFAGGIVIGSAGTTYATTQVYFNSVSMTGARDAAAQATTGSYALAIIGANPNSDVRDNALYNTQTAANGGPGGLAGSYAVGLTSIGLYNFFTSNYNDLYSSGASSHFSSVGVIGSSTAAQVPLFERTSFPAWMDACSACGSQRPSGRSGRGTARSAGCAAFGKAISARPRGRGRRRGQAHSGGGTSRSSSPSADAPTGREGAAASRAPAAMRSGAPAQVGRPAISPQALELVSSTL